MRTNLKKSRIFLGIDGGGTKTSAWVGSAKSTASPTSIPSVATQKCDETEVWVLDTILGRGDSGPGNPKPIGFEAVFQNLTEAIGLALEQAKIAGGLSAIDGACVGLAGVGRPEEKEIVSDWLRSQGCVKNWLVTDDIEPIRWAAQEEWRQSLLAAPLNGTESPNRTETLVTSPSSFSHSSPLISHSSPWSKSVSVIAGTGSIAQGYLDSGEKFRAGGWGYMLGDEGSGFSIAMAGLQSICQAYDQRAELIPWQQEILDHLQLESPEHLIGWIYQVPIPRRQLANLAEIVIANRDSDPLAAGIAADAVKAWKKLVILCCEKIGIRQGFGLAITGGVPSNTPDLVQRLVAELRDSGIEPANYQIVSTPVLGCLALAVDRYRPTES